MGTLAMVWLVGSKPEMQVTKSWFTTMHSAHHEISGVCPGQSGHNSDSERL